MYAHTWLPHCSLWGIYSFHNYFIYCLKAE